jgi:hypothetical protein
MGEDERDQRLNRLLIARNYRDALPLAQDHRYDVNYMAPDGVTALYLLSGRPTVPDPDRDAVVAALLAHPNIDVNKTEENGLSPLMSAIDDGNWPFVRQLLARPEIDINHVYVREDGSRETALDVAYTQLGEGAAEAQQVVDTLEARAGAPRPNAARARRARADARAAVGVVGVGEAEKRRSEGAGRDRVPKGGRRARRTHRKKRLVRKKRTTRRKIRFLY